MSMFAKNILSIRKCRCFSKCCSSGSKPTKPVDPCGTGKSSGPKNPSEPRKYDKIKHKTGNDVIDVCRGTIINVTFQSRKFSHNLPTNDRPINFEGLGDIPKGVFRDTSGEKLGPGPGADKKGCYLNVEYFSYHHMSYYDMHMLLLKYRRPSPKTGRKP